MSLQPAAGPRGTVTDLSVALVKTKVQFLVSLYGIFIIAIIKLSVLLKAKTETTWLTETKSAPFEIY